MLTDGRILVVEYKGAHLTSDAADKRLAGELWAEASDGRCGFAMSTGGEFDAIDNAFV